MPLIPSNDPDIALAQDWLGELEVWLAAHGTAGPDPFDLKQHPRIRAMQARPFLRRTSSVLCDRFPHTSRKVLKVAPTENPKTHALLATAQLRLHQLTGEEGYLTLAEHHLNWLRLHAAQGYSGLCWGYPFDVSGQGIDVPAGSPVCVVSAIAGQAFLLAHEITGGNVHRDAAASIAHHFVEDIPRVGGTADALCFAYGARDERAVHNANLLVAQHLLDTAVLTEDEAMARLALRAVQFTLNRQRPDGAFPYGVLLPGQPYEHALLDAVDHHHTGFVLRALAGINAHAENAVIAGALQRGFRFYRTLCSENGMPRNGHGVYPIDVHACAEAILCPAVLTAEAMGAKRLSINAMRWSWQVMRDPRTGAPYYRKYWGFTSKIAYPRWGVAWMYRALAEYLWRYGVQAR